MAKPGVTLRLLFKSTARNLRKVEVTASTELSLSKDG